MKKKDSQQKSNGKVRLNSISNGNKWIEIDIELSGEKQKRMVRRKVMEKWGKIL